MRCGVSHHVRAPGRLITERSRVTVIVRNHLLRNILRIPAAGAFLDKFTWIPNARYRRGFLSTAKHRAVGWQIPQPWVTDADGARVRFDDVLGGQWAIVHVGPAPRGGQDWAKLGIATIPVVEPTLVRWLQRRKAAAAVLRPDGFIYAAAGSGQPLPPPPAGFTGNVVAAPNTLEVSA